MGKLFIFMGKSAVGKDTLYQEVMDRNPDLKAVVPYTTRPIRTGETEGKEYHFVTEAQMRELESRHKVVERRRYHTVLGDWYYFTADDGQIDFDKGNYCMISTLEGFEKIREFYGGDRVEPIYIEVNDFVRIKRSLNRERQQENPCVSEVCRRFLADDEDFSEDKLERAGITTRIMNWKLEKAVCQIEAILADKKW